MTTEQAAQEIYDACETTPLDPYEVLDILGVSDEARREAALAAYESLLAAS